MTIGQELKRLRNERGMSARELGALANIHLVSIYRIEGGQHHPPLDKLNEIFGHLGYRVRVVIEPVEPVGEGEGG